MIEYFKYTFLADAIDAAEICRKDINVVIVLPDPDFFITEGVC